MKKFEKLKIKSKELRKLIFDVGVKNDGHLSTSLSCVEILVTLYFGGFLNHKKKQMKSLKRNTFVLSKGHAETIMYCILYLKNFISKNRMEKIKASSFLINTSRGDVIDQTALTDLLEKKRISGAGLDVFLNEPNVPPRLRQLSNVTLYPHIGSATHETRTKMGMLAVENLIAFFEEKKVPNQV